jgi:branched-chain amino acid transport system substrate-binding protein
VRGPRTARGSGRRPHLGRAALAVGLAVVAAAGSACFGGDDGDGGANGSSATAAFDVMPTTTVAERPADGRLTVGLLLPSSGDGAEMGQSMFDAAQRVFLEINGAGGVRGEQITVEFEDEGDTPVEAVDAAQALVDKGVDAVVGPAASTSALATLDLLLANGVLTCSPTATALSLDDFPDRDLFVRTAPSDSLQAIGLAQLAEQTGRTTVAVTWIDDVYGRPLATSVIEAVQARAATEVVAEVPFASSASTLDEATAEIVAKRPGVVIVIADADHGAPMLTALNDAVAADATVETPNVIVNDAMRIPPSPQVIAGMAPEFRANIQGLSPVATVDDLPGAFATNAYDCATLIALAAERAGPDDTTAMRAELVQLSAQGGICRDFATCAAALAEGDNVDYEGNPGPIRLGADGDPDVARYDNFGYADDGTDQTTRQLTVSR